MFFINQLQGSLRPGIYSSVMFPSRPHHFSIIVPQFSSQQVSEIVESQKLRLATRFFSPMMFQSCPFRRISRFGLFFHHEEIFLGSSLETWLVGSHGKWCFPHQKKGDVWISRLNNNTFLWTTTLPWDV